MTTLLHDIFEQSVDFLSSHEVFYGHGVELAEDDVVTAEIELWPETKATTALSSHPHFINREVFPRLADRFTQKQLLDELELTRFTSLCVPTRDI